MGSYKGPGVAFATNFEVNVHVMGGIPVIKKGLIKEFELASIIHKINLLLIDPAVFSMPCTCCFYFSHRYAIVLPICQVKYFVAYTNH